MADYPAQPAIRLFTDLSKGHGAAGTSIAPGFATAPAHLTWPKSLAITAAERTFADGIEIVRRTDRYEPHEVCWWIGGDGGGGPVTPYSPPGMGGPTTPAGHTGPTTPGLTDGFGGDGDLEFTADSGYVAGGELLVTEAFNLNLNQSIKEAITSNLLKFAENFIVEGTGFAQLLENPNADNYGCTDPTADNYDSEADIDNGSCLYKGYDFFGNYVGGEGALPIGFSDAYPFAPIPEDFPTPFSLDGGFSRPKGDLQSLPYILPTQNYTDEDRHPYSSGWPTVFPTPVEPIPFDWREWPSTWEPKTPVINPYQPWAWPVDMPYPSTWYPDFPGGIWPVTIMPSNPVPDYTPDMPTDIPIDMPISNPVENPQGPQPRSEHRLMWCCEYDGRCVSKWVHPNHPYQCWEKREDCQANCRARWEPAVPAVPVDFPVEYPVDVPVDLPIEYPSTTPPGGEGWNCVVRTHPLTGSLYRRCELVAGGRWATKQECEFNCNSTVYPDEYPVDIPIDIPIAAPTEWPNVYPDPIPRDVYPVAYPTTLPSYPLPTIVSPYPWPSVPSDIENWGWDCVEKTSHLTGIQVLRCIYRKGGRWGTKLECSYYCKGDIHTPRSLPTYPGSYPTDVPAYPGSYPTDVPTTYPDDTPTPTPYAGEWGWNCYERTHPLTGTPYLRCEYEKGGRWATKQECEYNCQSTTVPDQWPTPTTVPTAPHPFPYTPHTWPDQTSVPRHRQPYLPHPHPNAYGWNCKNIGGLLVCVYELGGVWASKAECEIYCQDDVPTDFPATEGGWTCIEAIHLCIWDPQGVFQTKAQCELECIGTYPEPVGYPTIVPVYPTYPVPVPVPDPTPGGHLECAKHDPIAYEGAKRVFVEDKELHRTDDALDCCDIAGPSPSRVIVGGKPSNGEGAGGGGPVTGTGGTEFEKVRGPSTGGPTTPGP